MRPGAAWSRCGQIRFSRLTAQTALVHSLIDRVIAAPESVPAQAGVCTFPIQMLGSGASWLCSRAQERTTGPRGPADAPASNASAFASAAPAALHTLFSVPVWVDEVSELKMHLTEIERLVLERYADLEGELQLRGGLAYSRAEAEHARTGATHPLLTNGSGKASFVAEEFYQMQLGWEKQWVASRAACLERWPRRRWDCEASADSESGWPDLRTSAAYKANAKSDMGESRHVRKSIPIYFRVKRRAGAESEGVCDCAGL